MDNTTLAVAFQCTHCARQVSHALHTKATNADHRIETNYTNMTCPGCKHVYCVKAILEDRGPAPEETPA